MNRAITRLLMFALLLTIVSSGVARTAETFPLKDGDTWVMVGDSITAQHLHSNYFEAFCYARYPKLTFRFRNSGVSGDTIPKALARFEWDVAGWKPTVVSVELGMNDQGGFSVDQYITGMGTLSQTIRSAGARPVFFTASPINNGETMAKINANLAANGNPKLHNYAMALKIFAAAQQAPYADQFHALVDLWGKNKPRENLANLVTSATPLAKDDQLVGVDHLRAFLAAQAKDPNPLVSMQGDPVHPGVPGQLMMAAALLKDLGASGFVSSATLDAAGKVADSKGCVIENIKADGGKLTFDRLDECLPFPLPDDGRNTLPLFPTILELSQYTLKVSGLADGSYSLRVNDQPVATVSSQEVATGVNLSSYAQGPIATQGKGILNAVAGKEGLVGQWRGALALGGAEPDAPAETKQRLAALAKQVDDADAAIRKAAMPQKLRFEISPAKL